MTPDAHTSTHIQCALRKYFIITAPSPSRPTPQASDLPPTLQPAFSMHSQAPHVLLLMRLSTHISPNRTPRALGVSHHASRVLCGDPRVTLAYVLVDGVGAGRTM